MTSFSGLTNASRALAAQTYALAVVGNNIANANTPGYTRESAQLTASGPVAGLPTLSSVSNSVDGTVDAVGTTRMNDPVLDARARTETSRSGYLDTTAATATNVEALFPEPSSNGLSEQLNKFWNAWSGVQNSPGDTSARNSLLGAASTLTAGLNSTSTGLSDLANATQTQLSTTVNSINQNAQSVGRLNTAIKIATASGTPTAALMDQRDNLLSSLASSAGASAALQSDGTVTVSLGSTVLVSGSTVTTVGVDSADNVTVGGSAVTLTGGSAKAQSEALTTTIPAYQASLDAVASKLASTVNGAHEAGFDLNGNAGGAFFTGTTAATITVAITDPKAVAASATGSGTADLDGSVAGTLANMGTLAGGADSLYKTMVAGIGSDVQNTAQQSAVQTSVTASVNSLQASTSGVSYDDEVTNMLQFQRAYQASSRVLTTVDEMLDTLINHTGRVGT